MNVETLKRTFLMFMNEKCSAVHFYLKLYKKKINIFVTSSNFGRKENMLVVCMLNIIKLFFVFFLNGFSNMTSVQCSRSLVHWFT